MLIHRDGASKVCLFSSYFKSNQIPYYVKFYLKELRRFFDQVVMLTNNDRDIEAADVGWLAAEGIDLMLVPNEGFDFGMWQKAQPLLDLGRLERLALVNDSCVCLAPLDTLFQWMERQTALVLGVTKSNERSEHIQSYFICLEGDAVKVAIDYLRGADFGLLGYEDVVIFGEIGLSRRLQGSGLELAAVVELKEGNPVLHQPWLVLDSGVPIIKRKVLVNPSGGTIRGCVEHGFSLSRKVIAGRVSSRFGVSRDVCWQLMESARGGYATRSLRTALRMFRYRSRWWLFRLLA